MLGLGRLREDGMVIGRTFSQFGDFWLGIALLVIGEKLEVFHVQHGDSVGVIFQDFDRTDTGDHGPAAVEFERDLLGIGELQ